jgi:hypothetical protein
MGASCACIDYHHTPCPNATLMPVSCPTPRSLIQIIVCSTRVRLLFLRTARALLHRLVCRQQRDNHNE